MIDRENDVTWVESGIFGGGACFEGIIMNSLSSTLSLRGWWVAQSVQGYPLLNCAFGYGNEVKGTG